MAIQSEYDLIVIGGGPAGYVAAIRASQLGQKVLCVEQERTGGTCLNWGCIPSKAIIKSAELYQKMKHAEDFGLKADSVGHDFKAVMNRSRDVAERMGKGIDQYLFKKNKIDSINGRAQVTAPGQVSITQGSEKGKVFKGKHLFIATGCNPRALPGLAFNDQTILSSKGALSLTQQPKSIIIVGGGAIGVEFAYFFNAMGTEVHLVEQMPRILPIEDGEVSEALTKAFTKQGIHIYTDARMDPIKNSNAGVQADVQLKDGSKKTLSASCVLVAIGVVPNLEDTFGPGVKPEIDEKGYLKVNECYQTSIPGIYAAGDIIGPPWLAHVASYQGIQCIEGIFKGKTPKPVGYYPSCVYCIPNVGSVGMSEEGLKAKGIPYDVGKFPFSALGKSVASRQTEGFVKLIAGKEHGELLGAHIIGAEATELIGEFGLALQMEATMDEIHHTIHAHPTLSEAGAEAAATILKQAIHF